MKKIIYLASMVIILGSCKTKKYDWENYTFTAVPVVKVNTAKSALPTVSTGNVSFFNLADKELAKEEFEFTLNWEGFGKVEVSSMDVYLGFYPAETTPPAYPIAISQPGGLYPNIAQFPVLTRVEPADKLYRTVNTFPATFTLTADQLAAFTGTSLASVKVNDYFLFKFTVKLKDGREIIGYQDNVCDEARGEVGDCRVGVRFKRQP